MIGPRLTQFCAAFHVIRHLFDCGAYTYAMHFSHFTWLINATRLDIVYLTVFAIIAKRDAT